MKEFHLQAYPFHTDYKPRKMTSMSLHYPALILFRESFPGIELSHP